MRGLPRRGGYPQCSIRSCAKKRGVTVCNVCLEFPRQHLTLLRRYPTWMADNERMREVGLKRWITEQEARVARGFAYIDIKFPEPSESEEGT